MLERPTRGWRLMSMAWFVSAAVSVGAAQTGMPTVVTPAQQVLRDETRLEILLRELAQETQALQTQIQRKQERLAARDPAGVQESEAALQRHHHNVQLLRREIDASRTQGAVTTAAPAAPKRREPLTATAPSPAASAPSPEAVGRWWDVYARSPQRSALGLQSPANALDRMPVEHAPRPPR